MNAKVHQIIFGRDAWAHGSKAVSALAVARYATGLKKCSVDMEGSGFVGVVKNTLKHALQTPVRVLTKQKRVKEHRGGGLP